jgi:hypothetical protein
MEIVYAAYTETGTFMLDERGVCRWAVAPPGKTHAAIPEKIVGAQYVATLDLASTGGLVDLPRVGCPMLFAATDETGHIQLVRTPPVTRFEDKRHPSAAPPASAPPRTLPSTPPLPLIRPAAPPRHSMVVPRAPSMPAIPTPSAIRTVPPVMPPPRRTQATIPPPPATDPSPPPVPSVGSRPRMMGTNGVPSSSDVQSMPTRIKGSSTQMRRMIRGR